MFKKLTTPTLLFVTIFLFFISACNKNDKHMPVTSLSMKPESGFAKTTSDTIMLSDAKALIKKIIFKNEEVEEDHDGEDDEGDDKGEHGDSCELKLKRGPLVVSLNLSGGLSEIVAGSVRFGIYDRVKFEIHKVKDEDAVSDTAFFDDSMRFSIVIDGLYNGTPFRYKSKESIEVKMKIDPPLLIDDSTDVANVTFVVDPSQWFKKDGVVLDPNKEENRDDIDKSIKISFKRAFKDCDHDGKENDDDDRDD